MNGSLKAILTLLTICGILMGGMLVYANTAYYGRSDGEVLSEKVNNMLVVLQEVRTDVKAIRKGLS